MTRATCQGVVIPKIVSNSLVSCIRSSAGAFYQQDTFEGNPPPSKPPPTSRVRAGGLTSHPGSLRPTEIPEGPYKYTAVEQIDGRYIQCHFEEPYGQLYKPEEGDGALGPEDVYENFKEYNTVEHQWPDMADHEDFLHFVKEIQDGLKSMKKVANIDGVLTYHAMEAVLGNWDGVFQYRS